MAAKCPVRTAWSGRELVFCCESSALKRSSKAELGGEFVFTKDGAQCLFAHIMKDQADHADVDKILSPLGADFMGVV